MVNDMVMAKRTNWGLQRTLGQVLALLTISSASLAAAGDNKIESKWTEVDAGKVHYLQAGSPKGLPILLLHGGRFQAETWRGTGTLKALAVQEYHVIAVDLPGFGKTPAVKSKPGPWLGKLIDALHLDRPVVVSPSMSGRFAMPFVVEHSDRLRGFVAVAPVSIKRHEKSLSRISVPLLAIWGERDSVIPLSHADLLLKHVPNSRKVVVPKASHALYMDDAETFHKELIHYCRELTD